MFVVLDGPDGCGKSTQARLLVDALRAEGRTVQHLREPGGTALGEAVRDLLLARSDAAFRIDAQAEVLLFFASRAQLVAERVKPALDRGEAVICERYVSSTFAYQALASGVGEEPILELARAVLPGAFPPDLTILFDLPAALSLQRAGARAGAVDRIEARGVAFHEAVRRGFLRYAELFPASTRVIDVETLDPAAVAERVRASVRELCGR